jgi:hemerythrin superfamily protein
VKPLARIYLLPLRFPRPAGLSTGLFRRGRITRKKGVFRSTGSGEEQGTVQVSREVAMDILDELRHDHQQVMSLFKKAAKKKNGQGDSVFEQLRVSLLAHSKAEEKVFYKQIEGQKEAHEMVLEGYEEHHVAELVLKELARKKTDGERWHAKLMVLQELVEHHVQEEEGEIFSAAEKALAQADRQKMGEKFATEKQKLMAKEKAKK